MGYELHIVRTSNWLDAQTNPIGRQQWNGYARQHPQMTVGGWTDWKDIGREPIYLLVRQLRFLAELL